MADRSRTGSTSYHKGQAAEEIAARVYEAEGAQVVARRWRCAAGEIDLVMRLPDMLVFAEVKSRRDMDEAASAVSPAQWRRLAAAAGQYLAEHADATTPCRFDLVLVDQAGRVERIENAASFDDW